MEFDLILTGGRVIDPANQLDAPLDVGLRDGKITRLAPHLAGAAQSINVSGLVVVPGLIDIHTHVYPFRPTPQSYVESVVADAHLFASGVTTTVDAGTTGWRDFPDFLDTIIARSRVRILALLNIARRGMLEGESEHTPAEMQPQVVASLVQAYPEVLVGIKSAHYWTNQPYDAVHRPWASVERAVEAGELCGKPVMVDFWPRPERPYADLLLKMLRPGDIHTHVFAQQFPILAEDGKVNDFLFEARQRGVHFDLGHGAASFWFRNAVPAFQQGFPPDTLSTDLHMANINGPVLSMLQTMSKYYSMGMPLAEVIDRSTRQPARLIHRPDLGHLSPGAAADIAVLRPLEGQFGFADCGKARLSGHRKLECLLTLRAGQVVYDPTALTLPEWPTAPEAYWKLATH